MAERKIKTRDIREWILQEIIDEKDVPLLLGGHLSIAESQGGELSIAAERAAGGRG
jgi:hypothetical protein